MLKGDEDKALNDGEQDVHAQEMVHAPERVAQRTENLLLDNKQEDTRSRRQLALDAGIGDLEQDAGDLRKLDVVCGNEADDTEVVGAMGRTKVEMEHRCETVSACPVSNAHGRREERRR